MHAVLQAGYQLGVILAEHPGMKAVVVAEVQRFLFRPGLQERARYYAVVFLTQLPLSHNAAKGTLPLCLLSSQLSLLWGNFRTCTSSPQSYHT